MNSKEKMNQVLELLTKLEIPFQVVEHEPVCTIEEANHISNMIEGIGTKSLFLKDKKKNYYLIILKEDKTANIKQLEEKIGTKHISFAKEEELQNILQLSKGSVTPFGIINDKESKVLLMIDRDLKEKKLLFHPNTNEATLAIYYHDLEKFIQHEDHAYILI